jgi:hypothetical protein
MPKALVNSAQDGPLTKLSVCQAYRSRTVADTAVPNGFHRRPGSEMLDDRIVPVFAILVTEDDVMCRHGDVGIGRLQIVGQFDSFAESGLGEMDMVNVGARGRCVLRRHNGPEQN